MRVYPPQTSATPLTVMYRRRMLPAPGEILVRENDRVEPVQVIGRVSVPAGFSIVNVAQKMQLAASVVSKHFKVKVGDEVKRGQTLAASRGLNPRSCKSPIDGTVTGAGGGRILIEAPAREVEIRANLQGVVSRVIGHRGVVIRATGALIQGAWGNGRQSVGILRLLVKGSDRPITAADINPSCHGMILIGGAEIDQEALERAAEVQVRGIVTGGIDPAQIQSTLDLPFPVVITEGLSPTPMCSRIYRLLSANDGREAVADARFRSHWGVLRPEVIVPLPAEPEREPADDLQHPLEVGDSVRVVRAPHVGSVGRVVALPVWTSTLAGARLPGARIELDDDRETLIVPLLNLEVLR